MLWVNKYKPTTLSQIIDNKNAITKIKNWLKTWSSQSSNKKACLINGRSGIGKTTSAILIAKEFNYNVIEYNASDLRTKNQLKNCFLRATLTRQNICKPDQKNLVIMDEVDGIDKGGNPFLISLIKITKIPIICICNERYKPCIKSLVNHCLDVWFNIPKTFDIAMKVKNIMFKEGFIKVDLSTLSKLCRCFDGDIRQIINFVQILRSETNKFENLEKNPFTNKDLNCYLLVKDLFQNNNNDVSTTIDKITSVDYKSFPSYIQENYTNLNILKRKRITEDQNDELLNDLIKSNDNISLGDVMMTDVLRNNNFQLLPSAAVVSSIMPITPVKKYGLASNKAKFPESFSKWQTTNKRINWEMGLTSRISETSKPYYSSSSISCEIVPYLSRIIAEILIKKKKQGIVDVMNIIKEYGLVKEDDLNLLFQVGLMYDDLWKNVPSNVKRSLTITFKKYLKELKEEQQTFNNTKKRKRKHESNK